VHDNPSGSVKDIRTESVKDIHTGSVKHNRTWWVHDIRTCFMLMSGSELRPASGGRPSTDIRACFRRKFQY